MFRRNPQVVQLGFVLVNYQRVEADDLPMTFGDKDLVS